MSLGNFLRASTDFQKALHISPDFDEARLALTRTTAQLNILLKI